MPLCLQAIQNINSPALPLTMQRQTQKPGCKEQKVFQLHILYSMASKEPDKGLYTEKIKVGGCQPNTTVFSNQNHYNHGYNYITTLDHRVRQSYPPIGNTVLQILALWKQYFPAFTRSRTQVFNKIKYLEKVEMFHEGHTAFINYSLGGTINVNSSALSNT